MRIEILCLLHFCRPGFRTLHIAPWSSKDLQVLRICRSPRLDMGLKRVMWVRRYQGQCRALRPLGHQGYRLRNHKKDQPLCSGYSCVYFLTSFCVYKAAFSSACSHSAACSRDDAQSKKQVRPTGPQLLWKRVQSMLFCLLFHRLAFVFAEEALCVVFTPLPLSSTSESTERCRAHSVKSFHIFLCSQCARAF